MSLRPQIIGPVPEETVRVARAAYPKGNLYLRLRDHLGTIYEDELFASIYPNVGQPAHARLPFGFHQYHAISCACCQIGRPLMRCEVVLIGNIY
jgi:hypothetical protein